MNNSIWNYIVLDKETKFWTNILYLACLGDRISWQIIKIKQTKGNLRRKWKTSTKKCCRYLNYIGYVYKIVGVLGLYCILF